MALDGSITTNGYDDGSSNNPNGRKYTLSWEVTSQSIENNTSTIYWKISCAGGNDDWYAEQTVKAVIDSVTVKHKTNRVERYANSKIYSGYITIAHKDDGSRSVAMSLQVACVTAGVNLKANGTFVLDTIPRKSSLVANNGTLNETQTLTVKREVSTFTHSIKATCGKSTFYLSGDNTTSSSEVKLSNTSIVFTPPLSWANENTTGVNVNVVFTIATYNDDVFLGENTSAITYFIPETVKPSCEIVYSDPTGTFDTYDGYIMTISKFAVTVNTTPSYGSEIVSYRTTANGVSYMTQTFTTDFLKTSGKVEIKATVTDGRGRIGESSVEVYVFPYYAARITTLNAWRSDSLGNTDDQGEYICVEYEFAASRPTEKCICQYFVEYKKSSETEYTSENITLGNNSVGASGTFVFEADSSFSYDVRFVVKDSFNTVTRTTNASTAYTIMHFRASGKGIAIGKVSEEDDVLDVAMKIRARNGIVDETQTESEWVSLSVNAWVFKTYENEEKNQPKYKASANVVTIKGIVQALTTNNTGQHVGGGSAGVLLASGIPEDLRPDINLEFVCQGSTGNRWTLTISTTGVLNCSYYGTDDSNYEVPTGDVLSFCCTYQV